MAGLGSFFLEIGVDQTALQRGLNAAESRLTSFSGKLERVGTTLSIAVSAPLALIGKNSIKAAADFETLEVSFGTMLKSMDKGRALMKDLQKYNLDTPFQSAEVNNAAKSLLAFGFAQNKIIPQLKMIGDLSAGVGIPIKELADIYGKARVQGRLFAEDINQLTGRGIPIIAEFAKQFGVSEQAIKKMTEDGKISFANLEKAFESMTQKGGQFYNMTANQSKTLAGIYSNFQDSVSQNLKVVGDSIVKNLDLKTVVPQMSKMLGDLAKSFSELSPQAQKAIVVIGGLAVVLPPLLALAGTILPAIATGFAAIVSPIGLAAAAVAVLTAALTDQYLVSTRMATMTKTVAQLEEEARGQIHSQAVEVGILNDVLQDNTSTLDEKKKALEGLQKISPEYFKGLKAENLNYSDLNVSLSKYITNLENATKAQILKSKIDQNIKAESDILSNPTSQTSALDLISAKTQQMAGRLFGNERYANSVANTVVLNAANNLTELRLTRKEYEKEFSKLLKAGYGGDAPVTSGGGSAGGGGSTLTDAQIKAAQKIAEETLSLRKDLQSQTRDLIIASMEDETHRAKSEAKKRAEDEIAAMREKMIGLKNLESEFAEWRKQREQSLANEIIKIQRESFKVPQEIKRQMITDVMNSIEPKDRKKLTSDRMQNSLDRTIMLGAKGIQSESDRTSVGKILGMDIDISKWQSDSASYIEAASGIEQANARMKNSVGEIGVAAGLAMGETVAQIMMGTAKINDIATSLLASVGSVFADILKQMAVAEAKALGLKALLGDPTALFRVIGLAAAGGLVGAFSNKVGQGRASNNQQRTSSQPSYSVTRGSNIYTVNKQYETIRNF